MEEQWRGRFPQNEIISLLNVNRRFNMAESTSRDLRFGEVLDVIGLGSVADLPLGYGASQGSPALREAVGVLSGVPPDDVIATQGCMLALYLLGVEVCRPGAEAVVLTPCFPPSRTALLGIGVKVVEVATHFEDRYRVDVDAIIAAVTGRTKLVLIATPQNPSGVSTDKESLERLVAGLARANPETLLVVDETYREATYGDDQPAPSAAGLGPRIIACSSVSKAYGAPGLRVGWMVVSHPELRMRLMNAKMNVVLSGSPLNEAIAARLLEEREAVLGPRRELLQGCLARVERFVEEHASQLEWVRPDAGALCCMRLKPRAVPDAAVAEFFELLESQDLQLAEGRWFGDSHRTFRLGFGYLSAGELDGALESLARVIGRVSETAPPGA